MSLDQLLALRRRFEQFVYESHDIRQEPEGIRCVFTYRMQGVDSMIVLEHQVRFGFTPHSPETLTDPLFQRAVFLLGLAEAISYWKTACPHQFLVQAGALAPEEILFWERLYTRGLGEFWYLNGIYGKLSGEEYIRVVPTDTCPVPAVCTQPLSGALIPVGGGKDSVVSLELLRGLGEAPEQSDCFLLSARKAAYDTAVIAGYGPERQVEVFRVFDPHLFVMNQEGYLNGHVPYSAILGFTAVAAALLRGRKYIVLSNEGSANEPTVPGTWVNHQYSKSLEFETDFQAYLRHHLTPAVSYFSLLRPWSEARIAMAFSTFPQYHAAYRSCNRGARENRWCCACPKCLFVFLLVAAHAGVSATTAMFGENLLQKQSLIPTLEELAGFVPVKPFECVGTVAETVWSLNQVLARGDLPVEAREWPLLRHFAQQAPAGEPPAFALVEPELGHFIPYPFRSLVLPAPTAAAERIRARLRGRTIGILGYGLEGKSTLRFLRGLFPGTLFPVADRDPERLRDVPEGTPVTSGASYASALVSCDLVFKAPGIPWKSIDTQFRPEQITSQTDLFLSVLGDRTIGITGTKGKSTTTALLQAALGACGHDTVMVGNMGIPALDAVMTDHPGRVYVCELSSHMLETIRHAPRGAVYLNLYEDHLDHYRSFADYAAAKDNLLRHQAADGFAVLGETVADRALTLGKGVRIPVVLDAAGTLRMPAEPVQSVANVMEAHVGASLANGTEAHIGVSLANGTEAHVEASLANGTAAHAGASFSADAFAERLLPGRHNLANIQTAFLTTHVWETLVVGRPEGILAPAVKAAVVHALNRFPGLPHRMRLVGVVNDIRFWDDSISTIPEATMLAVEAIGDVDTLIFGGMDRGISYTELAAYLATGQVRNLIGLPDTGHRLLEVLAREKKRVPESVPECTMERAPKPAPAPRLLRAADMDEAVAMAFEVTAPGRSCLLSPAAASYGWYRNFEERGDHFSRLVQATPAKTLLL